MGDELDRIYKLLYAVLLAGWGACAYTRVGCGLAVLFVDKARENTGRAKGTRRSTSKSVHMLRGLAFHVRSRTCLRTNYLALGEKEL